MKNRRYLFSLALCAMVLFTALLNGQFAGGNGTEEEPYLVETATHLNNVRNYIGSYFLQIDDIDLTGYNWVPIGVLPTPYGDQPFYGRFDGNNYLIENLTISNPNHDYIGLFGYSIDAELKNIRLSQVDIDAGSASCVGAITGIAINSFVSNCSVVSGSIEGDNLVGGLVGGMGTLFPYYANKKLSDEGSKKANKKFDVYSYFDEMIDQLLANFVGFNSKSYYDFPVSNITNSSADGLTVEGSISVGGILGYQLYSDVKVCYAQNEVMGEEEVGGLIGFMEGSQAFQTYSRSSVEAEGHLGGLVGKMTGSLVGNSYSTGLVTETQPTLYRGGLIGSKDLNSSVNDSYWDKETSGILISAGGIGKTTSEMTSYPYGMGTYTEWNFFNVWLPDEVPGYLPSGIFPINDGYPILVNLISRSTMDDFFEGDGTDLSPYEVSTWYHLSLIRNPIMLDKSFELTDDINLSGIPYHYLYDWLPIGCASYPFTGSLDGNGYVISNLQGVSGTSENSGLFGVVKNAKFVDVSLDNFTVSGQENVGTLAGLLIDTYTKDASVSNSVVSGSKNIGGLYGKVERKNVFTDNSAINGVTIENTSVTGSNSDKENIGGVIGYCSIDESNPNYNYNPIYIRLNDIVVDDVTVKGTKNVGGAIGYAYNAYIIGNGTLDHSISASSIEIEGHENVGGVIGYYQTRSRNLPSSPSLGITLADISVNDASIEATSATNVGGAIGHVNNADIDNCVITGLSIEVDNSENIGGLIGCLFGSKATYCTVEGGIVGESSENIGGLIGYGKYNRGGSYNVEDCSTHIEIGIFGDSSNIGGLVGLGERGGVKKCSSRGSIYQIHSIGTANNIGGLIGTGTGTRDYCLNKSFAATHIKANHRLGGLVGDLSEISGDVYIENCYATGNVTGEADIGGLVGYLGATSTISNSYSIGKVTGTLNVGGLVGYSEGESSAVENSYWDTVTSYQTNSSAGEGLMTVDMVRDDSEYTNWNFYNVWAMEDYTTYPYLQWQVKPVVHNYPLNGYYKPFIKKYPSQTCFWESFPVLEEGGITAKELLDPLTKLVNWLRFRSNGPSLVWHQNLWINVDFDIVPYNGYKLEFLSGFGGDLTIPGGGPFVGVPFDNVELELLVNSENWIGYYVPQPQPVTDAFDSIWPVLKSVTSETWSISRNTPQSPFTLPYPPPQVEFGKSYVVTTFADTTFSWNIPTQYITPQYEKRYPEYFSFNDGFDYEVFNIESIDSDQDVLEVGVFAGDTCVGASVFQGYPMQILAYTNPTHSEENLSFVIHRSSRGGDQIVRSVEVKDDENGEFYVETLKPFKQRYATIRLGAGEEIEEREEVVKPQFALSQNYPNPIVMGRVSRSSELTRIDFSLPEAAEVSLNVYNIKGQLVKTLASGELSAGRHTVSWDGNNVNNQSVGSGVYFYRLDNGKETINRKMLIVK